MTLFNELRNTYQKQKKVNERSQKLELPTSEVRLDGVLTLLAVLAAPVVVNVVAEHNGCNAIKLILVLGGRLHLQLLMPHEAIDLRGEIRYAKLAARVWVFREALLGKRAK
jgi:hypothetical protein